MVNSTSYTKKPNLKFNDHDRTAQYLAFLSATATIPYSFRLNVPLQDTEWYRETLGAAESVHP